MMKLDKIVFLLILLGNSLYAGDWTHWRGPNYNGSAGAKNIPISLANKKSIKWQAILPGNGSSTPVTSGDSIFLTCEMPGSMDLMAMCINRTNGKTRWIKSGGEGRRTPQSNTATPSAVTDGKKVFFMFGTGEFIAFDFDGKELWRRNIEKEYGKLTTRFGYSSSPLLYKGKLYVVVMRLDKNNIEATETQPARTSYFMAINPETGENIWKHIRLTDGREEAQESYTSPIPYEYGGRSEILLLGGDCLSGHDSGTGKELWRWKGYNPKRSTIGRVIPSPVIANDLVIVCAPRNRGIYAVRPNGIGNLGEEALIWEIEKGGSDSITPLLHNNILYVMSGQYGTAQAINPKDGTIIWKQKLDVGGAAKSSPAGVGDCIYNIYESGEVISMKAGKSFSMLERKDFGGKLCRSSITASGEDLLIRTSERLYCLGKSR